MPEAADAAVPAGFELAAAALRTLAELDQGQGVSLPRLAKRLGVRVSVLLRLYTQLSDAVIGGVAGPGWVRLACQEDGRWLAWITETGRGDDAAASN